MKLSREWLSEFTVIDASNKEFSERMTMSGSKVEGYEVTGSEIKNVVVGKVLSLERHPDSDHMWVCMMDIGQAQPVQIVTGAQNLKVGDYVPVAKDDSWLPGGVHITSGKLRGVLSNGMLCSLKELGLDTHDFPYAIEDGIFVLSDDPDLSGRLTPGEDVIPVIGFGDSVIEFEITNNRPDCLSMRGLARESAATFGTELKLHVPESHGSGAGDITDHLSVEIVEPHLCPRYTARMVRNIRIKPSPLWMRRRLRASGVRPINNIVDITNYVMLEYGQPMHAFDYSCVGGDRIIVRRANEGETLETLDGNTRRLTPEMLVIADESRPIGVAGVMGGGNSEITDETEAIVFESANFNGISVRRTGLALGMRTDASSRYEKGLDPLNTMPAVERACELVELLGAGEVVPGCIDVIASEAETLTLPLEPERVNALLGTDIDRQFMIDTLRKLDFTVENDVITVPSWRGDIEGFADIAEEVARFYGYDNITPTVFRGATAQGGYSDKQSAGRRVAQLCRGMGYYEIMTYSFGSRSAWDRIRLPENSEKRRAFTILNPLGEDTSVMRTTSLPSMLDVLATNNAKRNTDVKLYELATIYLPVDDNELADERSILTMGVYGAGADFFAVKGEVTALLGSMRIGDLSFRAKKDNPSYHPGRCAEVYSGDTLLGVMGQIHPLVCENYGIDHDVCAVELDFAEMLSCRGPEPSYVPLPRFPAVTRDIAIVCDADIPAAELEKTIMLNGGEYLESCVLFDVYTGAPIPAGKKSAAFSLVMRAKDQTLTDEHADETVSAVLSALEKVNGAVIR